MSHAATGIWLALVLARKGETYVWSYRANALTEMSKANRGAWREPMRQGREGECPNRDEQSESRCMAERNIHADQYVKSKDPPRHRNSGGA